MPLKELERLQAVNRFLKLEFSKEQELQELVDMAASVCDTSTAFISLNDNEQQYFKFKTGFNIDENLPVSSICGVLMQTNEAVIIPDLLTDERFNSNSFVTGEPALRFYAGFPIITKDDFNLGSLCVLDTEPKYLTNTQLHMLQFLAKHAINLMEFDASLSILKEQFVNARNSEIELRSFIDSSSTCHLLLSPDLEVTAFNRATSDFVKKTYHVNLKPGIKVTDYMYPEHIETFVNNCKQALAGTPVYAERHFEYTHSSVWLAVSFAPAYTADGDIIGISYNATDITQRVENEMRLLTQKHALTTIAYIQSHEMRRPVASILGLVNIFREENYHATQEELQMLEHAAKELDDTIKTIVAHTI